MEMGLYVYVEWDTIFTYLNFGLENEPCVRQWERYFTIVFS